MKYILITGAARGIGYGLAQAYGEVGYYVVAGVRNSETENVRRLKATYGERFLAVEMDVPSTPVRDSGGRSCQKDRSLFGYYYQQRRHPCL